jgi:hypothetical protein
MNLINSNLKGLAKEVSKEYLTEAPAQYVSNP